MNKKFLLSSAALALAGAAHTSALAADWSDTEIDFHYGTHFSEPFDPNTAITKGIIAFKSINGFKYGTNFFNVDYLASNHDDPGSGTAAGAQEVYALYRNTLNLKPLTGVSTNLPGVRDFGLVSGFDFNTKNDSYGSKKRMVVVGPVVHVDVPGFLDIGVQQLWESNAPNGVDQRFYYKTHPQMSFVWGIPIASLPLSFGGHAEWIAPKGKNEFGGGTSTETHIDANLMWDVGLVAGAPKHTFLIGFEYEYWRNKFGNTTASYDPGATAKTPQIRAEYHF